MSNNNDQGPAVFKDIAQQCRPTCFAQVVGQDVAIQTVQRLIARKSLPPTLALMGPPGTGKTTTARLVAMALNCANPDGPGEPCGVCSSCELIQRGVHPDVLEVDCATAGGVDDMRELIQTVGLRAQRGVVRVVVLNEFQEASGPARTSLAGVLEEPPPNVVFCLTTTKPASIPAPIMTRCLQLRFNPVGDEPLRDCLGEIAEELGLVLEPEALSELIRMSNGSVRTAVNALGRQIGVTTAITADDIKRTAAPVDEQRVAELVLAIGSRSPIVALEALQSIPRALRSFDYVLSPLLSQLHALYLQAAMPGTDVAPFVDCSSAVLKRLLPLAAQVGSAQAAVWLDITDGIANRPSRLMSDDAHLQMLLVRLCHTGPGQGQGQGQLHSSSIEQAESPAIQVQAAPAILPDAVAAQVAAREEARSGYATTFAEIGWAAAEKAVAESGNAVLKQGWAAIKPVRVEATVLTMSAPSRGSAKSARSALEKVLLEAAAGALTAIVWEASR